MTNKTAKVVVLSEIFPPTLGGSGTWLYELISRQKSLQFNLIVGEAEGSDVVDGGFPFPIQRERLAMKSRGIRSIASLRSYYGQVRLLRRVVKRERPDLILASRPLSEGVVASLVSRITGVPYLCFVHGEDIEVAATSRELSLATKPVLNRATKIIANSTFTKSRLVDAWGITPEKVQLIHPGVDCDHFMPDETIQRPDAWKGKSVLLTVGRLQERKGHDTVISAIKKLGETHPNLHYVVAGDGEDRMRLANLAKELGVDDRVEFLGKVSESGLKELYQTCDIFVMANRAVGKDVEGFGIVFLEAQACGKPVIAGASGGTSDTLVDGKTGMLVDCQDSPEPLVRSLKRLLDDQELRGQMGHDARAFVESRFDWHSLTDQWERFISEILPCH